MSVHQSVHRGMGWPYMTITLGALDLTVQYNPHPPPPRASLPPPQDIRSGNPQPPPVLTSDDHTEAYTGWRMGRTHHTGVLSRLIYFSSFSFPRTLLRPTNIHSASMLKTLPDQASLQNLWDRSSPKIRSTSPGNPDNPR